MPNFFKRSSQRQNNRLDAIYSKWANVGVQFEVIDEACVKAKQPVSSLISRLETAGIDLRGTIDTRQYETAVEEAKSHLSLAARMSFMVGLEYGNFPDSLSEDFFIAQIDSLLKEAREPMLTPLAKLITFWREFAKDEAGTTRLLQESAKVTGNMVVDCYKIGVLTTREISASSKQGNERSGDAAVKNTIAVNEDTKRQNLERIEKAVAEDEEAKESFRDLLATLKELEITKARSEFYKAATAIRKSRSAGEDPALYVEQARDAIKRLRAVGAELDALRCEGSLESSMTFPLSK
jgi:hypothetical protein